MEDDEEDTDEDEETRGGCTPYIHILMSIFKMKLEALWAFLA